MRKVRRRDWSEVLENLLRDAARTERLIRMAGLRPERLRSAMPNVVHDLREAYGYDPAQPAPPLPSSAAISRWDYALILVSGAPLTADQRSLLWDRAKRRGWKQLEQDYGRPMRGLQRLHARALAELCAHAAIVRQREIAGRKIVLPGLFDRARA